ncbi:MAG: hypothetical protein IPH09_05285 [bacterium]|nr:hypothetical protein [bacterium]
MPAQPIAIDDLLDYLAAGLALPVAACRVYEIGGADRVSYADIMRVYARGTAGCGCADPGAGPDLVPVQPVAGPGHAAVRADRRKLIGASSTPRWSGTTPRSRPSP